MTIANNIIAPKPEKLIPATNTVINFNMKPLITSKNSPKVNSVSGNEKNLITGFTNPFNTPSTKAPINAVPQLAINSCVGKNCA